MSSSDMRGPMIRIGNPSPRSGRATVKFEIVMEPAERDSLLESVTGGETALGNREDTLEALGIEVGGDE